MRGELACGGTDLSARKGAQVHCGVAIERSGTRRKEWRIVGKPGSGITQIPEQALAMLIWALQEPSYDKWLARHDPAAIRGIEARNKEQNRGREQWEKIWQEGMVGRTVTVLARVDYVRVSNRYALFSYEVGAPAAPHNVAPNLRSAFKSTAVFKLQGSQWVASHDLSEDRVLIHLDETISSPVPVIKTQRTLN